MKKLLLILASVIVAAFSGCITDSSGIVVEKGKMVVYNQRLASHMTLYLFQKALMCGECSGFVGAFPVFTRSHYEMCLYGGGFNG